MSNRIKTKYPGVYYREAKRIAGKVSEKVFYISHSAANAVCFYNFLKKP